MLVVCFLLPQHIVKKIVAALPGSDLRRLCVYTQLLSSRAHFTYLLYNYIVYTYTDYTTS